MKLSTTSRDSNDHNNNNNHHHHTTPNKDQLKDHDFALTFSSGGGLASPVLILGLNAALQKRIFVHNFQVHEVNRVASTDWGIGGKGQNAFYASLQLPISHPPKLIQFIGQGHEGDVLGSKLSEIASTLAQSTECFFTIRQKTSCRTCTSIIDLSKSEVTELVESTGPVTAQEVEYLMKSMEKNYSLNRVDGIAVMGSLPNGCLKTLYSDILQRVCNRHSKVSHFSPCYYSLFSSILIDRSRHGCGSEGIDLHGDQDWGVVHRQGQWRGAGQVPCRNHLIVEILVGPCDFSPLRGLPSDHLRNPPGNLLVALTASLGLAIRAPDLLRDHQRSSLLLLPRCE